MKLKTRLTVTFLTVVLLPIILMSVSFLLISQYQLHILKKNFGINSDVYGMLSNSVELFSSVTDETYDELQDYAENTPYQLEDKNELDKINSTLLRKSSFLIVTKDGNVYYKGKTDAPSNIMDLLPEYDKDILASSGELYVKESALLIKEVLFDFSDGSTGVLYIITQTADLLPQLKSTIIQMLIAIMLVLILTGIALVSWIYNGLVSPIKQLTAAARKISEGTLDFDVTIPEHDDEISDLCRNFDEMRKRLKESAEEKVENESDNRELISNITHDLKTPVTSIKGYAEGIIDGVADTPEKRDKYIRTIYNKANDLDRLINELTFYSGIDANRIPYNFAKINISDYFQDCVDDISVDLESRGISLDYQNSIDSCTRIIADPVQMKKVINNIVGNSIKYMDKEKGAMSIRLKDADSSIIIEIEDNGKGIAAKDLPYIFDRFYRTDSSRNSSKGGSGIGLSIVKKIVEDQGGRIWATSQLGAGTTMLMEFRKYIEQTNGGRQL